MTFSIDIDVLLARAAVRAHTPATVAIVATLLPEQGFGVARVASLVLAINAACDERGDDEENRRALIDECSRMLPEHQLDLLAHFSREAVIWRAANCGRSDALRSDEAMQ